MRIDFASLAFGYRVKIGGATPNWATSLGQGKDYKINTDPSIDEILKGVVYSSVPLTKITAKIGKGGKLISGDSKESPIILAAVFDKVFVNDVHITNGRFILLITRDNSESHAGRLRLKYGPSNTYEDNGHSYSNHDFFQQVKHQLKLADDACWFVSDISVANQNELILKTIVVDSQGTVEYEDSDALHTAWNLLEPILLSPDVLFESEKARNRIVFGAPGTGKSYKLEKERKELLEGTSGTYERVTFHPDYTYSNFVGTYKPVTELIDDGNGKTKSEIRYEFVPGPFMRVYVDAFKSGISHKPQPHLLLIEEINRAKVAAVFGDMFQLLDRDDRGVSVYEIHATEDIRNYLAKELGGVPNDFDRIRIPDNMFIWATMNSADQGVFPMDTAFKRRWNFEYIGINNNEGAIIQRKIVLGMGIHRLEVDYNKLRKAINEKLVKDFKVNEDKLIGPFFLSMEVLETIVADDEVAEDEVAEYRVAEDETIEYKVSEDKDVNLKKFTDAFKSKVLMYLYEDAAKQHRQKLFSGCDNSKYSSVCEAFDEMGIDIFGDGFRELYNRQGV